MSPLLSLFIYRLYRFTQDNARKIHYSARKQAPLCCRFTDDFVKNHDFPFLSGIVIV